ncbi:type I restriction enzyme S subunit [Methanocalculus alkaliphilus]|uniref:restriction endonuclease subunit S n=1 Tax=Methanocalculus alkaliphilus TaxID=768730 RepID=UPI00209E3363|nr:restriction endonuclease subunit S [Methanocalculus alkaliphilus]MCP1715984.1 type I restriction enzyme S subunit [Methanocalculus alkaliphilus]
MSFKNDWKKTKLNDVISTQKGFAFKSSWYCDEGRPIVKVSDFTDDSINANKITNIPNDIAEKYLRYELQEGDVVIQTVGSWPNNPASVVGKCIRVPYSVHNSLLNQNAVRLDPKEIICKSFLYYLLRSPIFRFYIVGTAQGAASQAAITLDSIRNYEFELPPLPTQRKIAAILSAYDDLIENNTRRIKILEEMAQNLYREWFVKFRFPGHEHARFVDSPLGRIPEGWEVKTVDELSDFISRGITPKYQNKSDRYIINQKSNAGNEIKVEYLKELNINLNIPEKKLARTGDLLINCLGEGTIGRVHFFLHPDNKWAVDQHMSICRSSNVANMAFLYYLMNSPEGQAKIQSLKSGGTNMTTFNISELKKFDLIFPEGTILNKFYKYVIGFLNFKLTLQRKNTTLRTTRDLLLPRLISGEVDVSDLNITIPEAAMT